MPWSTRKLREAYQAGADAFGWRDRLPRPRSMRKGSELIGWGLAGGAFPVYTETASVRIRLDDQGTVEVATGVTDIGTGTRTILVQTVCDLLGVATENVRVLLGDTRLPPGPAAGSSQLSNALTTAVAKTAEAARNQLIKLAANGMLRTTGEGSTTVSIADLLRALGRDQLEVTCDTWPETISAEDRQAAIGTLKMHRPVSTGRSSVHSWCAQFVEVAVDEDFGTVRVRRMVGAFDCGFIYNPTLAASQWKGGMIMGLGQALLESLIVDRRYGRIVNGNLAEYLLPVNADVPDIQVISVGEPDFEASPLGGKTVGEIGIVGTAAAIANAVFHATGTRIHDLPITMEKLLCAAPDGQFTGGVDR